jgi:flagellar biosynthetic protein FliP
MRLLLFIFLIFITFQNNAEETLVAPTVAEKNAGTDFNETKPDTVEVGRHVMGNIDAGSMILSLLAVLLMIVVVAWILKKLQVGTSSVVNGLKVVTSLNLGAKERLIVVQVGKKQLLLGVTAQQINLLETLAEPIEIKSVVPIELSQKLSQFSRNSTEKAKSEKFSYLANSRAKRNAIENLLTRLFSVKGFIFLFLLLTAFFASQTVLAADDLGMSALKLTTNPDGSQEYTVTLQILMFMTALGFIPAAIIMMTSFTRIVVIMAILRQAIGLQQTPSNQVIIGLTLFMTMFIMTPVYNEINQRAIEPYLADQMTSVQAMESAKIPLRAFMLEQTRIKDLETLANMAGIVAVDQPTDLPMTVIIPAFIISELKTAFQIGFMLFIPFLIIDLVVASILMAMGMMMLSPMIVSLPFKLMLFVLVDGWNLVIGTIATSYGMGSG